MIRGPVLIAIFFVLWVPTLSQTEYLFTRFMTMVGAIAICFGLNWLTSPKEKERGRPWNGRW